jgi:hypothetical protein
MRCDAKRRDAWAGVPYLDTPTIEYKLFSPAQ